MRDANHSRFGHILMRHQRTLDFRRAEPVAGDVQHIVDAAGDPVIAVLVAFRAIASEIHAGNLRKIRLLETRVVAVNRPRLPRP